MCLCCSSCIGRRAWVIAAVDCAHQQSCVYRPYHIIVVENIQKNTWTHKYCGVCWQRSAVKNVRNASVQTGEQPMHFNTRCMQHEWMGIGKWEMKSNRGGLGIIASFSCGQNGGATHYREYVYFYYICIFMRPWKSKTNIAVTRYLHFQHCKTIRKIRHI